jgi:23S rRNA pseudouridine2457 synthase
VQVNNTLSIENLQRLRTGVMIRIKEGQDYLTPPCDVSIVTNTEITSRYQKEEAGKYGKHTWLQISLTEGKFRQVRKMMYAVRHRCKRLIRISIEDILLDDLEPGKVKRND